MNFNSLSLSQAVINKKKLLNNIQSFKKLISKNTNFMAVIKANAYGHGAIELAKEMEAKDAVDYFGVAQLKEAIELRVSEIKKPILIFNETALEDITLAIKNNITMTVFSKAMAKEIVRQAESLKCQAFVHLKIDSGMSRIGLSNFDDSLEIYQLLNSFFVKIEGIYTHFADANEKDPNNFSHEQFRIFKKILDEFEEKSITFELKHACNTAATINYSEYQLDMVRVGIGLYGFNPTLFDQDKINLNPIQNIYARVMMVKDFPAGKSIGYNRNYFSKKEMKVATIGMGYADGVAKSLSNKGYFRYQGQKIPIVGDVCMDQIMLDCSAFPELKAGDFLSYFGDPKENQSSATEIAQLINSSNYELLCRIGNRVERIYK